MVRTPDSKVWALAINHRPKEGVTQTHIHEWLAYLKKHCDAYDLYEEYVDGEGMNEEEVKASRHLHGRCLFTKHHYLDDVKKALFVALDLPMYEKHAFYAGILRLYAGTWEEYMSKDGRLVHQKIHPDGEDAWLPFYADPDQKREKKNPNAMFYRIDRFIGKYMEVEMSVKEVERLLNLHIYRKDRMKYPANPTQSKNIAGQYRQFWEDRTYHGNPEDSVDEDNF